MRARTCYLLHNSHSRGFTLPALSCAGTGRATHAHFMGLGTLPTGAARYLQGRGGAAARLLPRLPARRPLLAEEGIPREDMLGLRHCCRLGNLKRPLTQPRTPLAGYCHTPHLHALFAYFLGFSGRQLCEHTSALGQVYPIHSTYAYTPRACSHPLTPPLDLPTGQLLVWAAATGPFSLHIALHTRH